MVDDQVAAMRFADGLSGDEIVAVVRNIEGCVGLTLSLRQDGDVEVWLCPEDCDVLVAALQQAISEVRDRASGM